MNRREKWASFLTGFLGYPTLELFWRGRTHWSMALAGGLSMLLLYPARKKRHFCLRAAAVITGVELVFGCIFNLLLKKNVWDYSRKRGNLWGQICLPYCLLWFLLGVPVRGLCNALAEFINER